MPDDRLHHGAVAAASRIAQRDLGRQRFRAVRRFRAAVEEGERPLVVGPAGVRRLGAHRLPVERQAERAEQVAAARAPAVDFAELGVAVRRNSGEGEQGGEAVGGGPQSEAAALAKEDEVELRRARPGCAGSARPRACAAARRWCGTCAAARRAAGATRSGRPARRRSAPRPSRRRARNARGTRSAASRGRGRARPRSAARRRRAGRRGGARRTPGARCRRGSGRRRRGSRRGGGRGWSPGLRRLWWRAARSQRQTSEGRRLVCWVRGSSDPLPPQAAEDRRRLRRRPYWFGLRRFAASAGAGQKTRAPSGRCLTGSSPSAYGSRRPARWRRLRSPGSGGCRWCSSTGR